MKKLKAIAKEIGELYILARRRIIEFGLIIVVALQLNTVLQLIQELTI